MGAQRLKQVKPATVNRVVTLKAALSGPWSGDCLRFTR